MMRAMRILALVVGFGLSVLACSDSTTSSGSPDLLMSVSPDLSPASKCGVPTDTGNSKGVGKYCTMPTDCPTPLVCSKLFYPGTFFCTLPSHCTPPVDTATCGENTVCTTDPNLGTGCTPAKCAPTPQG
jgi:hypothetical protein